MVYNNNVGVQAPRFERANEDRVCQRGATSPSNTRGRQCRFRGCIDEAGLALDVRDFQEALLDVECHVSAVRSFAILIEFIHFFEEKLMHHSYAVHFSYHTRATI